MKHTYILISFLIASAVAQAQSSLGYAFSTGGNFGGPGNHVKTYLAKTGSDSTVTLVDSVAGDFSNGLLVEGQYAYVHIGRGFGHPAGDDRIYKYDLANPSAGAMDSSIAISGIYGMQILGNQLVVTRDFPASANYLQVLDKNDLHTLLFVDNVLQAGCKGLQVANNKAYTVSTQGNAGRIEVYNLDSGNWMYEGPIQLDSLSAGGDELLIDGNNAFITGQRYDMNWNFLYAAVTQVNLNDSTFSSDTTGLMTSQALAHNSGMLYGNFGNPVQTYNTSNATITAVVSEPSMTSMALNTLEGGMAVQSTDYFSFGKITVYDNNNNVTHEFDSDVSGSAIALVSNHAPVAVDDSVQTTATAPDTVIIDVLANDYDLDGQMLTLDSVSNPTFGTVAIENGMVLYMPYGSTTTAMDSFTYVTTDPWGVSATATVRIDITLGLNEVKTNALTVYPNPTQNVLFVKGVDSATRYTVYSISGVEVMNGMMQSNAAVNVGQLPNGIYVLQVGNGNESRVVRFSKQ